MGKPAARITDPHTCPVPTHGGGHVLVGVPTVLIGGFPAATLGSACTCTGATDVVTQGSLSVLIGGRPAARLGDLTTHGGTIAGGCPTVLIGDRGAAGLTPELVNSIAQGLDTATAKLFAQRVALSQAARSGAVGCEDC